MRLASWLTSIRRHVSSSKSRRRVRFPRRAEKLEDRTLLSASFDGQLLQVDLSANEDTTIRPTGGNVEVLIDGTAENIGTVAPGAVQEIEVIASSIGLQEGDNTIDLLAVTAAEFNSLTRVFVEAGDGDDSITGSEIGDSIDSGNGNDTVLGGEGADSIDGDDGDDSIVGGNGNDNLLGEDGNDIVLGELGEDTIDGGDGDDSLDGADGVDSISGGNGSDTALAGAGDDFLNGQAGDDQFDGGAGNDRAFGGAGRDTLTGGDGNDKLNGQSGRDEIAGDAGQDTLIGALSSDSIDGGDGDDQIRAGDQGDTVAGGAGDDEINGQGGNDVLRGGDDDDTIFGGAGGDLLDGNLGDDTLQGQGGNDTLLAKQGEDFVEGDSGNDLLDALLPQFSIDNVQIDEGDAGETGTATFTVTLSQAIGQPAEVAFAMPNMVTVDGQTFTATATADQDYVPTSGVLQFDPGETEQQISVTILGDDVDESDEENFFVELSSPVGAQIFDGVGEGRIADDDPTSPVDVFFLLDDTTSFQGEIDAVRNALDTVVTNLQTQLPNRSLAFGVGRFEAHAGNNLPFILNQPTISTATPQFDAAIDAALARSSPGSGLGEEPGYEALLQLATGVGFDGNGNGSTLDNGAAGLVSTQTQGDQGSGDVPAFSSFTPDPSGPVVAPSGTVGGAGFRSNAEKLVILASDSSSFVRNPDGVDPYTGVGGVTVPAADLIGNPFGGATAPSNGAEIQQTIDALIAERIQVIGMGVSSTGALRTQLEGISTLTGAVNETNSSIDSGDPADPIDPGEPLFFLASTQGATVADAITNAVIGATGEPPPPPPPSPQEMIGPGPTLLGNNGNDTIIGSTRDDLISGNSGDDDINGSAGRDSIFGGVGNDTMNGGDGQDKLKGQLGVDVSQGGNGNDTIKWATGDDDETIQGGAGFDQLLTQFSDASNAPPAGQPIEVVESFDRLILRGEGQSLTSETLERLDVDAGGGDDQMIVGQLDDFPALRRLRVAAGPGNDNIDASALQTGLLLDATLNGAAGDDTLLSGPGGDFLDGGAGNDSLGGGDGGDTLDGGAGFDLLRGQGGDDSLLGGAGIDQLRGDAGNDTGQGGDGDDIIDGGSGNDLLEGEAGRDALTGEAGNDTLRGGSGRDLLRGEDGADSLQGGDGDDGPLPGESPAPALGLFGGDGDDTLEGQDGTDFVIGGDDDDLLTGGFGDDKLNGNGGNDVIFGDRDNDKLFGGSGDDFLDGGVDDDTLNGHSGDDSLRGRDGDDDLRGQSGSDTILGDDGNDRLVGGDGSDGLAGQDGNDTVNGQGGADSLLGGNGADAVRGGAGNDTLLGGDGDDTLDGQGGDDILDRGQGNDLPLADNPPDEEFVEPFDISVFGDWIDDL